MPRMDSLPRGQTGRAVVRLGIYRITRTLDGTARPVTFACLVQSGITPERELTRAARGAATSGNWLAAQRALERATTQVASKPVEIIAAEALWRSVFPNAQLPAPSGSAAGYRGVRGALLPPIAAASSDDFVDATTDNRKVQQLGPVVVTADRYTYVVYDLWQYLTVRRYMSFSDIIDLSYLYNDGPNCADESEFYFAQQDAAQRMEDNGAIMGQIATAMQDYASATGSLTCERIPDKPICVDFFIQADRSAFFGGDNRDFNPEAGYLQSRVQFFLNPNTRAWEVKINESRLYFGGAVITWQDSARLFRPAEDVQISKGSDGTLTIALRFYNNFCLSRESCPAIDAALRFVPNPTSPGGYDVYWKRDGFPSMGVYRLRPDGSGWDVMAEDSEKIRNTWLNWTALAFSFKQSVKLPPGCMLQ